MPVALLHPGVYIEEVSSGVRSISGVATSIALFIGWAPRGPTDSAMRISSYAEFERAYGGLDGRADVFLGYAVKSFYDNGGTDAYILRIAHTDAATGTCSLGDLDIEASSPGDWSDDFSVRLTQSVADATRFTLDVIQPAANNAVLESFADLSMTPTDRRFVQNVVNGRSTFMDNLVATSATTPANGTQPFAGGDDGTVLAPTDANFTTPLVASLGVGGIVDQIDLFNIVCVPGLVNDGAIAATATTISALQTMCRQRRAFLVVDSPPGETAANIATSGLANISGSDANYSALYYPWVRQADPQNAGSLRAFPPCGFVAGIYARTDAQRGVWKAPAGTDASLNGAAGFETTLSDAQNGNLNPIGINCLRTLPVYGNVTWGARTLHGQNDRGSEWKYVPVRRTALFLEESLFRGTQWVVFEPNDEPLWAQIRLNVGAFMQGLFRQGAFQGRTPKEAYFVKCDRETTTQADINLGIVNIHVGFAPLKPAEFVVLRIQQIAGELAA
jgi:uncharacterized protein